MVRVWPGSAARDSKLPARQERMRRKASSPTSFPGVGVRDLAVLDPDATGKGAVDDFEDEGILRKAFQLDDVDEAFALDAAEAALVGVASEEGLDAVEELFDFLAGAGFLPVEIDAEAVNAGAELFVNDGGEDDGAHLGEFAADDGEDLKAVHLGHVEIADENGEGLGIHHGQRAGPLVEVENLGTARQLGEDLLVKVQQILVIIQQQDFGAVGHSCLFSVLNVEPMTCVPGLQCARLY